MNRVSRFDYLFPHTGAAVILATAAFSLYLSRQPMGAPRLFWNAALVQALPVLVGVLLSSIQARTFDVAYSSYGTFFASFALLSVALSGSARTGRGASEFRYITLPRSPPERAGNSPVSTVMLT
jgi:hypothetical protein